MRWLNQMESFTVIFTKEKKNFYLKKETVFNLGDSPKGDIVDQGVLGSKFAVYQSPNVLSKLINIIYYEIRCLNCFVNQYHTKVVGEIYSIIIKQIND